jgi:hypothetical protein
MGEIEATSLLLKNVDNRLLGWAEFINTSLTEVMIQADFNGFTNYFVGVVRQSC